MAAPPGWKLHEQLDGTSVVTRPAWSADGSLLAVPASNGAVVIWDAQTGKTQSVLLDSPVLTVAFSPDAKFLASGVADYTSAEWAPPTSLEDSYEPLAYDVDELLDDHGEESELFGHEYALDSTHGAGAKTADGLSIPIHIIELATGTPVATLWSTHIQAPLSRIVWSPSGDFLVTASRDGLAIWQARTGELLELLTQFSPHFTDVACRPDRDEIVAVTTDGRWMTYSIPDRALLSLGGRPLGHSRCVAWSRDRLLACGRQDGAIEIWHTENADFVRTLEAHPGGVLGLSYSADGRLLASRGTDGWVRLWDTSQWDVLSELRDPQAESSSFGAVCFSPVGPTLATTGEHGTRLRLWTLDVAAIAANRRRPLTTHYVNAKVVLVGDSGVGKTGLGLVLAGEPFRPTESTHRRHVWLLDQEVASHDDEPEMREIYLWDLAGQSGYRLLHQLHLRDVAVALVVFDAKNEKEPFGGVRHWVRALRQAETAERFECTTPRLLVAARMDRGGPSISDERIQSELQEGGFIGPRKTSAKEGWGVEELGHEIRELIEWARMPRVSSTGLFDSVKDFLIAEQRQDHLLVPLDSLYRSYLATRPDSDATREEFANCLGRLAARGLVRPFSFGTLVLLQPELLDAYAAALVNAALEQPDGMGSLLEEDVLDTRVALPQGERIDDRDLERLLLIACVEDLLRHEIALRESSDDGALLVFPTQSKREAPPLQATQQPWAEIRFEGPVQHVYAILAVRLAHSGFFDLDNTYASAATFNPKGSDCTVGIAIAEPEDGEGLLTLFGTTDVAASQRRSFQDFVVSHVRRRAVMDSVVVEAATSCAGCGYPVARGLRKQARELKRSSINCPFCTATIELTLAEGEQDTVLVVRAMDLKANQRRDLAAAQSTVQGKEEVREFDVFLAHNSRDKALVARLAAKLRDRALNPWLDDEQVPPGRWFQDVIEAAIPTVRSAAIIIGAHGIGAWEHEELRSFLQQCTEAQTPVIPVLIGRATIPKSLRFLAQRRWIKMSTVDDDHALDLLIWGITGERPDELWSG